MIKFNTEYSKQVKYKDLKPGDTFLMHNDVYIKIAPVSKGGYRYNMVKLVDGTLDSFSDGDHNVVFVVDLEVKIIC